MELTNGRHGYLFGSLSRFKVYQVCKKFGYVQKQSGNINNSVTHSFRHNFAREVNNKFQDVEVNKNMLNHKSKLSQSAYLKVDKKKKIKYHYIKKLYICSKLYKKTILWVLLKKVF